MSLYFMNCQKNSHNPTFILSEMSSITFNWKNTVAT